MSKYNNIDYTIRNGVATVVLNSPDTLNAFNQVMRLELIDVVAQAEADQNVRVVVLAGQGRAFCAGADLTEGMPGFDNFVDQCEAEYTPWLMGIHNSKKLYIAAVNGVAAGIGSAAMMNCDLVVMAEDAYMYQAFSAIGLMPDGGAVWLLLNKLGYHRAIEMAVDAGKLTAQQCLDYGLANRVVANNDLMHATQKWAEALAAGASLAQASTKELMRKGSQMSYLQVIEEESRLQSKLIKSEDAVNAVSSFLAKRDIVFNGR